MDPMLIWDGFSAQAVNAGVLAPLLPPNLVGDSSGGPITGSYGAYLRFVDRYDNPSNLSPFSNEAVLVGANTVFYSNIDVPTESKVTRRQILRNTDGEAAVYYVDIDTTDLASTHLTSTLDDNILSAQEAVPILDSNGLIFADRYGIPPNWKTVIANLLNRMFAAGEEAYVQGHVEMTFGSATVTGIGTEWNGSLRGRFLYIVGGDTPYEINSVDPVAQTLTLVSVYAGATDKFAVYAIRPAPAERRLLYWSESGAAESWSPINSLSLPDDGDDITGLMAKGSFLYILESRHIYRFSFQDDPGRDGFIFLTSVRGCVNQKCWVLVEDVAYMLDEAGIHAFSGGQESEPISTTIQGLFRNSDSPYRVQWQARRWFHAANNPTQETIRWFVTLEGDGLPRHAIAYNYRTKRWWLEEYPFPVGSSATGMLNGERRLFLGSDAARIFAFGVGSLDGADASAGTVRGTVTSATLVTLTDSQATFAASGLVGSPVSIVSGRGKGQQRRIAAVSGTTLTFTQPWLILPDSTSIYQVGGVPWTYKTGDFRFVNDEEETPRRAEVIFKPTRTAATMDLRLYHDFSPTPVVMATTRTSQQDSGVAADRSSSDLSIDLTKPGGLVQKRFSAQRDLYIDGPRWLALALAGVQGADPVTVFEMTVDGVAHASQQ